LNQKWKKDKVDRENCIMKRFINSIPCHHYGDKKKVGGDGWDM
jgi:hypothetical protein